ncbi:hypothetical protein H7I77_25160 [Mycolicibacterium novocastrense]|uniref:Uncharacterized protein n=1 Tax=Mycolicibacterium novocastrense TaxID=59813 RepID=A0AAW5SSU2_MYCNV|nr:MULTISPECIES: hypothetical protein [Mycolicibacterium]MCV7026601.1 hypothetical protein [Mycolicibacterium novocastrense]MDX1887473.1 hypothetical protein [Mycolicibacterium sp. 120270]GAT07648.1 uncharacterized protein RMCN_0781 [Mycolicibacterium novocastrense]
MIATAKRLGGSAVAMLAALTVATVAAAPAAMADTGDGVTPADSHGIPIGDYLFGFNYGAGVFGVAATPDTTFPAGFAAIMFGVWIAGWWLVFTVFNLFQKMDWITPIVGVAENVSTSISDQFGEQFIYWVVTATMLITITVYALRNQANRAWHHVALTIVAIGIGVLMVLPVGEAAHLLKMGRDIAAETGTAVTGHPAAVSPSAGLIDEYVRKPTQRWQYGQDLDSLGCGWAWDDKIRAGDADKMKDAPLVCPGGDLGARMHAHAMNPAGALTESILYPLFMVVVAVLIAMAVVKMGSTAVGALIHAAFIKPGLIAVGTPVGQRFLIRNVIDGFTAALVFGGYLLILFITAALVGILGTVVPSSDVGMLITLLVVGFAIGGVRYAGANMRGWKDAAGRAILPAGSPGMYGQPSRAPAVARHAALSAAHYAADGIRTRRQIARVATKSAAAKAGAGAVAPEIAIPTQVMNAFAHEVLRTAHHYRTVHQGGSGRGSGIGVAGSGRGGGAQSVNYGGSGGGAVGSARELARRSSQRRAQTRAAESVSVPAAAGTSSVRPPSRPAPLRTSSGARSSSVAESPSAVAVAAPQSPVSSAGPVQPAGGSDGRSAPPPAGPARSGVNQALRRSGAINTARNAARNFRKGRQ